MRLSTIILLLCCVLSSGFSQTSPPNVWTVLAFDVPGDGRDPALADAAQLAYRYDKEQDMLWFRVALYAAPDRAAFGVNIVVDTGASDDSKMNWWGRNKQFKFDKLLTVWITETGGVRQGTIGVGDPSGVKARIFNNLLQNNVEIRFENDSVILGIKRTDLTDKMKMNLIAAVGSNDQWNDDIPDSQSVTLDLAAARPTRSLREIDLSRNNFVFGSGSALLAEDKLPRIVEKGSGRTPLILVPGVYSGPNVFDGFIARNLANYRFYLVTPPGLNETPARRLPAESVSYGELPWTRRLEKDILELVKRRKLKNSLLVAHGFPGSLAAVELAHEHPELFAGIIDIAAIPVQPFFSPRDPAKKATPEERIVTVNTGFAGKWFKYVTPETWESNNYRAVMYANDPEQAERTRRQVEAAPLEVKIRYLAEFMAADQTSQLDSLSVPLLAVRPGFDEKVLMDPPNAWFKAYYVGAWDALVSNPKRELITIPNARALLLDDQPQVADEAIGRFLQQVGKSSLTQK